MTLKSNFFVILIFMIFISCSSQTSTSGVLNRPLLDDSQQVFTVLNRIRFSKKDDFKDLLYNKVMPSLRAYKDSSEEKNNLNKMVNDNSYMIEPKSLSSDSTWMFVFIVKPYIKGATNYNIIPPLKQMFGEDETKKIIKKWNECYSGDQVVYWSSDNLIKIE